MIESSFTVEFRAIHKTSAPARRLDDPEAVLHGHHYAATFTFRAPGAPPHGAHDEEQEANIRHRIGHYFDGTDLSVLNFDTTPATIAAYLFEMFRPDAPALAEVELLVDGAARYVYWPAPEDGPDA